MRQIGSADSSLSRISGAIRWIRAHFAENFRVEELAQEAHMSPATFYRHFRAVTHVSPPQFQKRIRLQHARTRLLADSDDVAVVGFTVEGDQVHLGPLAGTMMACVNGMDQEQRFLKSLSHVERYRISGQRLELLDRSGAVLARFEAAAPR